MRDETDDLDVWGQVAAEDVSVGNLLEMGNIVTTHFRQPAWGKAGRFVRDGHMIASGQEDPRTTQRGHTIHHNLEQPFHLATDEFFAYHKVFEASHAQGGVSGYAHHGQLFNGRRGLALDVPFGLVDFIEVLQGGRLDTAAWYPFLNLGFKVSPAAGSDYPVLRPVAARRRALLRQARSRFDADAWYASFKAGHVFVTNGPMLDFTINGQPMGARVAGGEGRSWRSRPRRSSIRTSIGLAASSSSCRATSSRHSRRTDSDRVDDAQGRWSPIAACGSR